eukprot:GHVT01096607.1.p1 GENE.GHVT01096607.1~~GHVT01096607.1.p1  ORF type:complete len:261 (+),score=44.16 GHVT01096607.1:85-867(+)
MASPAAHKGGPLDEIRGAVRALREERNALKNALLLLEEKSSSNPLLAPPRKRQQFHKASLKTPRPQSRTKASPLLLALPSAEVPRPPTTPKSHRPTTSINRFVLPIACRDRNTGDGQQAKLKNKHVIQGLRSCLLAEHLALRRCQDRLSSALSAVEGCRLEKRRLECALRADVVKCRDAARRVVATHGHRVRASCEQYRRLQTYAEQTAAEIEGVNTQLQQLLCDGLNQEQKRTKTLTPIKSSRSKTKQLVRAHPRPPPP